MARHLARTHDGTDIEPEAETMAGTKQKPVSKETADQLADAVVVIGCPPLAEVLRREIKVDLFRCGGLTIQSPTVDLIL